MPLHYFINIQSSKILFSSALLNSSTYTAPFPLPPPWMPSSSIIIDPFAEVIRLQEDKWSRDMAVRAFASRLPVNKMFLILVLFVVTPLKCMCYGVWNYI